MTTPAAATPCPRNSRSLLPWLAFCSALLLAAPAVLAVDGVIEINHAKALAGGVVTNDTAGYPVTIDVAGSYRLTGDLTIPSSTNGINISADSVTLDLNGFTIQGQAACTGLGDDVVCTGSGSYGVSVTGNGARVANGTVSGHLSGVAIIGSFAVVDGIRALRNSSTGISAPNSAVSNCLAFANAITGILATGSSVVTGSQATSNKTNGFQAGGVVRGNASSGNLNGYAISDNATVLGNTAIGNRDCGFNLWGSLTIGYGQNVTADNAGGGICNPGNGTVFGANACGDGGC